MSKQTPESALLRLVLDYLAAERIFAIRMNTGAVKTENRFFRFGVPGMADVLAFKQPEACDYPYSHQIVIWLELKAGRGVQSELQRSFQIQVTDQGHRYAVIHSLEELKEALK